MCPLRQQCWGLVSLHNPLSRCNICSSVHQHRPPLLWVVGGSHFVLSTDSALAGHPYNAGPQLHLLQTPNLAPLQTCRPTSSSCQAASMGTICLSPHVKW